MLYKMENAEHQAVASIGNFAGTQPLTIFIH